MCCLFRQETLLHIVSFYPGVLNGCRLTACSHCFHVKLNFIGANLTQQVRLALHDDMFLLGCVTDNTAEKVKFYPSRMTTEIENCL